MAEFNTLDQVVQGLIDKFPERYRDPAEYWTLLRHGLSWFNESDRVLAPARATVEIMLQADRSADLPDDYVDWLVVGKREGDRIVNLCFNEKVTRLPPVQPSATPTTTMSATANLLSQVPYHGYLYGELYGYGGGVYPANEFVVDKEAGKLYTNSEVEPGVLYFSYIYNKDKPNKATPIPVSYMMPLELWIEWQRHRRDPDANTLMKNYWKAVKDVSKVEGARGIDSWYDLFDNRAYGQIG